MPTSTHLKIRFDREDDGRWIAEIEDLPGCLTYGHSQEEAATGAVTLALRILADRLSSGAEHETGAFSSPFAWHLGIEALAA